MTQTAEQQRANRLVLAHFDMEDATNYLHALSDVEELQAERPRAFWDSAKEAVLLAAITVYARSFVRSESIGFADKVLDVEPIFHGHPELRTLHKRVLDLRQKAVAHADWKYHGTVRLQTAASGFYRTIWRPDYRKDLELWQLWALFTHVNDHVVRELIQITGENLRFDYQGPPLRLASTR